MSARATNVCFRHEMNTHSENNVNEQNLYERISNYCFNLRAIDRVGYDELAPVIAVADCSKIRSSITGIISHYGNCSKLMIACAKLRAKLFKQYYY